jgi:hypothetical protein
MLRRLRQQAGTDAAFMSCALAVPAVTVTAARLQVTAAACSALEQLAKDANTRSDIRQAGGVVLMLPFVQTGD